MKGTIRENLGASRYVVGVTSANQPLADEIQKCQDLYDATIPRITDAYGALNDLRDGYNAALDAIAAVAADYELCRLAFSSTNCLATGRGACESAYLAADAACLEIESGIGECDPDCQRERARCQEAARSVRDACLAQVAIDCAEAQFQHVEECQKTWAPLIAKAQEAALKLLPGMQEALYNLQHEQALQWQLARKLNELEGIQTREYQITCFSAQYHDDLSGEVEMARTPNGRHVITGIVSAPTPCLHDARVLPSGHLFVNAALWPGFETWRPTWRVGTVQEVLSAGLKVEFAPATMAGGLGTLFTENPLDCTPPQCYFDGKDPVAAEADIKAARVALKEAQQTLLDAVAVRAECLEEYDQTWFNLCYQGKTEACDAIYGDFIEQAEIDKGACYETATSNCETTVNEGLAACSEQFQPTIDEKQGDVDAAQADLTEATNFLIGKQGDLLAAQQALEACLIDPEETPESCAEQYQPAIDAAQIAVDAAYTVALNAQIALTNAAESLEAAQKDLKDCQDGFVLADCIANAIQLCDDTYQQAQDTYTQQKAACYQEGLADCDRQRDAAIQACYDASAEAITAAQTAVDAATRDVELATKGRYNPANPLILDCPVAHCSPENYQVGDEVLIDFPVRTGSMAMASWDSRRVIGWASNTRTCGILIITYWGPWNYGPSWEPNDPTLGSYARVTITGNYLQEHIPLHGNGTAVTAVDGSEFRYITSIPTYHGPAVTLAQDTFLWWYGFDKEHTRQETDVKSDLSIGAVACPIFTQLRMYVHAAKPYDPINDLYKLVFYVAAVPFEGPLQPFSVPGDNQIYSTDLDFSVWYDLTYDEAMSYCPQSSDLVITSGYRQFPQFIDDWQAVFERSFAFSGWTPLEGQYVAQFTRGADRYYWRHDIGLPEWEELDDWYAPPWMQWM